MLSLTGKKQHLLGGTIHVLYIFLCIYIIHLCFWGGQVDALLLRDPLDTKKREMFHPTGRLRRDLATYLLDVSECFWLMLHHTSFAM